jgi:hypothetical protein
MWGWMKSGVNKRKVDTRDELLARFSNAAGRIIKHDDQLTTHAIFATQLQSAFSWTVVFLNICCEP